MARQRHTTLLAVMAVLCGVDQSHALASDKAFATYGTEKMIYDACMDPQAVRHKGVLYIVYQADRTKSIGNPHIITYDSSCCEKPFFRNGLFGSA